MTELEALVSLNMVLDIGSIRLNRLLEFFGSPQNIISAPEDKLILVSGIGGEIAAKIRSLRNKDLNQEFSQAKKLGLEIITYKDDKYPKNLKNIPDPAVVLYVKGRFEDSDELALAVVGSRHASFYGLRNAEKFARELADLGICIVSGMARGIDTAAHRGALKSGGRTIAVMGSGFNHIYPEENRELSERISLSGAVISEFPLQTGPLKQNFPRRNRLISGLSRGVLVLEAARNSGALITADFALEQGRDVFALPGEINSANSCGTNGLLKQGAKLVTDLNDILEEFNLTKVSHQQNPDFNRGSAQGGNKCPELSYQESLLYSLISDKPAILDEIIEEAKMDIAQISSLLLKLEMRKLIRQLPGKQFIRSPHAA